SPDGYLHRPNSQGYEAQRSADHAADQVRVDDQPNYGEGARSRNTAEVARPFRRGDRMMWHAMHRRSFLTLLGGASSAAAWPLAARAQQRQMPVIGYLSGRSRETDAPMLAGFRKGLAETGYVENRNVEIDFRFADGEINLVPALAADLVRRKPAVIVTVGSN